MRVRGSDPREVVIGLSPAFGNELTQTTAGHDLIDVVLALTDGVREGGGVPRLVRIRHTADTSFLGLTAARLSGSGYAIGIQAKGTAVIHRADRLPHMNIELFSNAPVTTLDHYRAMGRNAALHALGRSARAGPRARRRPGARRALPRARRHALCDRDRTGRAGSAAARPRSHHRPARVLVMTSPLDLYPLSENAPERAVSASGMPLAGLTLDAVVSQRSRGRRHPDLGGRAATSGGYRARGRPRPPGAQPRTRGRTGCGPAGPDPRYLRDDAPRPASRIPACCPSAPTMLRRDYGAHTIAALIDEAVAVYERRNLFRRRY